MKNSFVMYNDWKLMVESLDNESRGELLLAIMEYQAGDEMPNLGPCASVAFACMKAQFDKDDEKYEQKVEERREAGRAGGLAKARNNVANLANARNAKQNVANLADSVNDNDSGNDSVNESDNDNVNVVLKDNENNKKENVLTDIREKSTQEQAFDQFWDLYPKKKSKGQAKRAWDKLKPDQDTIMAIMAKLPELIASDDWRKDGGQYIPYPATWLNAEGWKDEVGRPLNKYEEVDRWAQAISQF